MTDPKVNDIEEATDPTASDPEVMAVATHFIWHLADETLFWDGTARTKIIKKPAKFQFPLPPLLVTP